MAALAHAVEGMGNGRIPWRIHKLPDESAETAEFGHRASFFLFWLGDRMGDGMPKRFPIRGADLSVDAAVRCGTHAWKANESGAIPRGSGTQTRAQ